MQLADLEQTLLQAVAADRIGTPVAFRLHAQLAEPESDLAGICAAGLQVAEKLLGARSSRLFAQQNSGGNQWQILVNYSSGATVSLTVGRGISTQNRVNGLVVGNHGIARLEEDSEFVPPPLPLQRGVWSDRIEHSLRTRAPVDIAAT